MPLELAIEQLGGQARHAESFGRHGARVVLGELVAQQSEESEQHHQGDEHEHAHSPLEGKAAQTRARVIRHCKLHSETGAAAAV